MKVGFCAWQFIAEANRRRFYSSGRPATSTMGADDLFFVSHPIPELDTDDPLGWLFRHARGLGFDALEISVDELIGAPDEVERLEGLRAVNDVALTTHYWDDCRAPQKSADDFKSFVRVAKNLSIDVIGVHVTTFDFNRFVDDPPLGRQLQLVAETLKPLAEVAEAEGITLALENHADYRTSELLEGVVEPIGSSRLGFKLDTGNCAVVLEDPVDAATRVAPRCYATHLKDMAVHPITMRGGTITGAPIGLGHCRLDHVIRILAENAPDPDNLILCVEESSGFGQVGKYFEWLAHTSDWLATQLGRDPVHA
jgi:sugar phosphate isomerase/epimerase